MASNETDADLIATRRALVASIQEVMGVARAEADHKRAPDPYLHEVARLSLRLLEIQEEIEQRDLD